MRRTIFVLVLSAALAAAGGAQAGPPGHHYGPPPGHRYYGPPGHHGGVGILGPLVGAIIGFGIGRSAAVPEGLQPWSPEWYDYCGAKYRTFDPRSGYYNGIDGQPHFCR